jgi:membrane-associated phospholipid phosphatase
LNPSIHKLLQLDAIYSARLRLADKPGSWRTLAILLAHSGDSWFWLVGLAILWLTGNTFWKTSVVVMLTGIIITAALVFLIKFIVRRQRPAGEWGAIYRKTDPHSFPSGHAARAALLAVIAAGLGPVWFCWLLLIWAPLVILARVSMGVHYLSDVIAGALLGLLVGALILNYFPLAI